MEELTYTINDSTIAQILGEHNFTSPYSAILEIIKNSYDACATQLFIIFEKNVIKFIDNGHGMDRQDIISSWMKVGSSCKSDKYYTSDNQIERRVLAGSKGIGRFALAKLGRNVTLKSFKKNSHPVRWKTDWTKSSMTVDDSTVFSSSGTFIEISQLRDSWTPNKINQLNDFLSRTILKNLLIINIIQCNDNDANIVKFDDIFSNLSALSTNFEYQNITNVFDNHFLGISYTHIITLQYNSKDKILYCEVESDEFTNEAHDIIKQKAILRGYLNKPQIDKHYKQINIEDELLSEDYDSNILKNVGDFSAKFFFSLKGTTSDDVKNFCYKHYKLTNRLDTGVILYRNNFSISSYEGTKDWIGLNNRAKASPAAATHKTGLWRVRSNQLSGIVNIDKDANKHLADLSNRQGLDENIYFNAFLEILQTGISEFEKYRQHIIRTINAYREDQNNLSHAPTSSEIRKIANTIAKNKDFEDYKDRIIAFINSQKEHQKKSTQELSSIKYDVRLLNVLASIGLRASSVAHDINTDRNFYTAFSQEIVESFEYLEILDTIKTAEYDDPSQDIMILLERLDKCNDKILSFMDTLLKQNKKSMFKKSLLPMATVVENIVKSWENDYSWVNFDINNIDTELVYLSSIDIHQVILDNLILNSIQNFKFTRDPLLITIEIYVQNNNLYYRYKDNGPGLHKKFVEDPYKILQPHVTTRPEGHGLGMWIIHNTITKEQGEIANIDGSNGFIFEFYIN